MGGVLGAAPTKDAQKILDELAESVTSQSPAEALSSAQGTPRPFFSAEYVWLMCFGSNGDGRAGECSECRPGVGESGV